MNQVKIVICNSRFNDKRLNLATSTSAINTTTISIFCHRHIWHKLQHQHHQHLYHHHMTTTTIMSPPPLADPSPSPES